MEDADCYVPESINPVRMEGQSGGLVVVGLDLSEKIVRVRTTEDPVILCTVPWSKPSSFG
jgi:hypothetical protein